MAESVTGHSVSSTITTAVLHACRDPNCSKIDRRTAGRASRGRPSSTGAISHALLVRRQQQATSNRPRLPPGCALCAVLCLCPCNNHASGMPSAAIEAGVHTADLDELPYVTSSFRYRKPLQPGEPKPAFNGENRTQEAEEGYEDQFYTEPLCSVINARARETPPSLAWEGFCLAEAPSQVVDFYDLEEMRAHYHKEMCRTVKKLVSASAEFGEPAHVLTNGHITRNEAEAEAGERLGSHHLVHNDFTPDFREKISMRTPLVNLFIENGGRVCIFNTWRRFDPGELKSPLGLCDATTIMAEDLIPTSLANYGKGLRQTDKDRGDNPIGTFDIYQASENENHQWYYYPRMNRDEALVFKTYVSLCVWRGGACALEVGGGMSCALGVWLSGCQLSAPLTARTLRRHRTRITLGRRRSSRPCTRRSTTPHAQRMPRHERALSAESSASSRPRAASALRPRPSWDST
jgi:hypothetical protein